MTIKYPKDLTGLKFNRPTALNKVDDPNGRDVWLFRCDCGTEKVILRKSVTSGRTKSCRCLSNELAKVRNSSHGHTRNYSSSKIYEVWCNMRRRCLDPKNKSYKHYGGRGITVCERWLDFSNFYADMGDPPSPKHTLDRIDNNGGYCPSNCRWADTATQIRNRRTAFLITYNGVTQNLCDWAKQTGILPDTISSRIKLRGWTVGQALGYEPRPSRSRFFSVDTSSHETQPI